MSEIPGPPQPEDAPTEDEIQFAAQDVVQLAEFFLKENSVDTAVERFALPAAAFAALDAYIAAQRDDTHRELWIDVATYTWHNSPEYKDDAGYPTIPLGVGQQKIRERIHALCADASYGPEYAESFKELGRMLWLMAIAREPDEESNSFNLPPEIICTALDAYFAADDTAHGVPPRGFPCYPELNLLSETVLRASMAAYNPDNPNPQDWQHGLPTPIKAALDAIR